VIALPGERVQKIILGITGASGSLYLQPFLDVLHGAGVEVHGVLSPSGRKVMALELGMAPEELAGITAWHDALDFAAAPASGSAGFDAMVVLPCSMGTLAAIAAGVSATLIHRAADVTLKERKPLLLAVRETPLNRTHLKNMLQVHDAGATVVPAMPAFYHRPQSIHDLAGQFACRLASLLELDTPDLKRWGGQG